MSFIVYNKNLLYMWDFILLLIRIRILLFALDNENLDFI